MKRLPTLTALLLFLFCTGFPPPAVTADQSRIDEEVYWARFFPNTGSFSFARARMKKRGAKLEAAADDSEKSMQTRRAYQVLLADLNRIMAIGGSQSKPGPDHTDVFIFWQLGQRISGEMENASDELKPVSELVEALTKDLELEKQTLSDILLFYQQYAVLPTVSPRLSWQHYQILIRIPDEAQRRHYQTMAVQKGWDADELLRQAMKKNAVKVPP